MGSLRRRLGRLESAGEGKACPRCQGRIILAEIHPDGTVSYPLGEPCEECGSKPLYDGAGIIEVMLADDPNEVEGDVPRTWPP